MQAEPLADTQAPARCSTARRAAWLLLGLAFLAELLVVGAPIWIIRPFRAQSPRALQLAIALRNAGPIISGLAFLLVLACAIGLWRGAEHARLVRNISRALLSILIIFSAAGAYLARAHYFQWFFHPIAQARFLPAEHASLPRNEMVLDVKVAAQARAYPIWEMAYHHIFNDRLAGLPIVATY